MNQGDKSGSVMSGGDNDENLHSLKILMRNLITDIESLQVKFSSFRSDLALQVDKCVRCILMYQDLEEQAEGLVIQFKMEDGSRYRKEDFLCTLEDLLSRLGDNEAKDKLCTFKSRMDIFQSTYDPLIVKLGELGCEIKKLMEALTLDLRQFHSLRNNVIGVVVRLLDSKNPLIEELDVAHKQLKLEIKLQESGVVLKDLFGEVEMGYPDSKIKNLGGLLKQLVHYIAPSLEAWKHEGVAKRLLEWSNRVLKILDELSETRKKRRKISEEPAEECENRVATLNSSVKNLSEAFTAIGTSLKGTLSTFRRSLKGPGRNEFFSAMEGTIKLLIVLRGHYIYLVGCIADAVRALKYPHRHGHSKEIEERLTKLCSRVKNKGQTFLLLALYSMVFYQRI